MRERFADKYDYPRGFEVSLDGGVIIDSHQPTIDGRILDIGEQGTYQTPIGKVVVDLTRFNERHDAHYGGQKGLVVVSGEALKRPAREGSKDLTKHRAALSGVHEIHTGTKSSGVTDIGMGRYLEVR